MNDNFKTILLVVLFFACIGLIGVPWRRMLCSNEITAIYTPPVTPDSIQILITITEGGHDAFKITEYEGNMTMDTVMRGGRSPSEAACRFAEKIFAVMQGSQLKDRLTYLTSTEAEPVAGWYVSVIRRNWCDGSNRWMVAVKGLTDHDLSWVPEDAQPFLVHVDMVREAYKATKKIDQFDHWESSPWVDSFHVDGATEVWTMWRRP